MYEPAPLAADVPGYGVVGRAPAFRALTEPVLSRFRRPHFFSVTSGCLREMLSQHSILLTRQVNCSFGLKCLAQILLRSCGSLLTNFQLTALTTW